MRVDTNKTRKNLCPKEGEKKNCSGYSYSQEIAIQTSPVHRTDGLDTVSLSYKQCFLYFRLAGQRLRGEIIAPLCNYSRTLCARREEAEVYLLVQYIKPSFVQSCSGIYIHLLQKLCQQRASGSPVLSWSNVAKLVCQRLIKGNLQSRQVCHCPCWHWKAVPEPPHLQYPFFQFPASCSYANILFQAK